MSVSRFRNRPLSDEEEEDLMAVLWSPSMADRPRVAVQYLFPWGEPDTPLHDIKEPWAWQIEVLEELEDWIRNQKSMIRMGLEPEVYFGSTSSGRGIGKSALYDGMIPLWFLSCAAIGGTVIATANTQDQLRTKTWAELGIWHTMAINSHWFHKDNDFLRPTPAYGDSIARGFKIDLTYYRAQAQTWDEKAPSAFAGVHNRKGLLVLFEEATGIADNIWPVAEGFFTEKTTPYRFFFAVSNPRMATGKFFETHHKMRHKWHPRIIDSRSVEATDKKLLAGIIEEYGIDSPEACAEVTGQFPDSSDTQFIGRALIQSAVDRAMHHPYDYDAPIIIGVDVARQGDDQTVIWVRHGRNARQLEPWSFKTFKFRKKDNIFVANQVAELVDTMDPDAVNIDVGMGSGVIDILRSRNYKINEIDFGSSAEEDTRYKNRRTEMWARGKKWLSEGCIPADNQLTDDLKGPNYHFVGDGGAIILEPKEKMKDRGLASPDSGDALMLTFAVRVARRDKNHSLKRGRRPEGSRVPIAEGTNDNPLKW